VALVLRSAKDARGGVFKAQAWALRPHILIPRKWRSQRGRGDWNGHGPQGLAAHDCGRALNPVSVEGQVIGSVWMGWDRRSRKRWCGKTAC